MGILDWFINRQSHFELEPVSRQVLQSSIEKAVSLVDPRLKLVPSYHKRLQPAVESALHFLQETVQSLPPPLHLVAANWSSCAQLRAFFTASADITRVLGASNNVRTFFNKYQDIKEAWVILDMKLSEQQANDLSLQEKTRTDLTQTIISFSDHKMRICGQDISEVHRLFGAQGYEYLVAQTLSDMGEERTDRRMLEEERSILRARLRLLQQQGPGLGSVFSIAPDKVEVREKLETLLLENERQIEALASVQDVLEERLARLCDVLQQPEHYMRFENVVKCVDSMNVVVDQNAQGASDIHFSLVDLSGTPTTQRAFVLANFFRSELPEEGIDFTNAARLL